MNRFDPSTRDALTGQGWRLMEVPGGLTLEGLRRSGAPFKGEKFFREYAPNTAETGFSATEVAYRPGLMPLSLNVGRGEIDQLRARLETLLPDGACAGMGSAAVYVWLLSEHFRVTGEWLLTSCFTFTMDRHLPERGTQPPSAVPIVVGVFGGTRPIMVSPLPEGRGRGVGLLPLVLPAGVTAQALP